MEWQPIDTAPKDGSRVDLVVQYANEDIMERYIDCYYFQGRWECDGDQVENKYFKATHWMPSPPLPPPPKQQ